MLTWLPENVSTAGREIDFLFYLIYYVTGAVFILVMALLVFFLIRYRQRSGRRAVYTHGNTALEITWTVIPAAILLVLTFLSASVWMRIKVNTPAPDLEIRVTAKQFNWEILYPGPDGKFATNDDLQMDNELHVPVNKVVSLVLTSKDVIHSFFLPNLRLKQDAVPGRDTQMWFEATKSGKYEAPCAELCGFGHSGMKGWLYVHTAEGYEDWMREKWPGKSPDEMTG
ncbi:MAG: cytochrome c oxidase subunit II [Candidatus Binatia bacterium]